MKKYIILVLTLLLFCNMNVYANESINVSLYQCVDGDTAKFKYNNDVITARFLGIDTPETQHPTKGEEPWGKEASNYTCKSLTNSKNIKLEYDDGSSKTDKYNRHLVWVFIDGKLLQNELVNLGYAKVAYIYGNYKYTDKLYETQEIAIEDKVGLWGDSKPLYKQKKQSKDIKKNSEDLSYKELIIILIIIIILCMIFPNYKKMVKRTIKKEIKKEIKNLSKK